MNSEIKLDPDRLDEIAPQEVIPNGSIWPAHYPETIKLSTSSDSKQASFVITYQYADEPGELEAVPGTEIFPVRVRRGKVQGLILNLTAIPGEPLKQRHLHAIADILERAAAGIKKDSQRLNFKFVAQVLREADVATQLIVKPA